MAGRLLTYVDSVEDMLNDLENVMNDPWDDWFNLTHCDWKHFVDDRLLVEVKKGRIWRGIGYMVGYREETYCHWIQRKLEVYDPIANEIHLVSVESVTLHPIYKEGFKDHMLVVIKEYFKAMPEDMRSGFAMDHQRYFYKYLHICRNFITLPQSIRYPEVEARLEKQRAKKAAFKEVKFPELIKWAESKGKTGQEAIELAERVWQKKYA